MMCTAHQIYFERSNQEELNCCGIQDVWGIGEVHTGLCREAEGKRPFGRPILRWEDFIKMDWIDLAQDGDSWHVVNAVMNLRVS
jgi:hypothetical protein